MGPTAGATAPSPPPLAAQRRPSLSPHAPPPPAQSQARRVSSPSDTRVWCTASVPPPPPLAPPVCSPSPTPGSPTTHAQTGYTGARLLAPPGAPPRLTPLVFMSITRVTMGSAPQTPPAPPQCHPRLVSGGPGPGPSTLAAPLHPSRGHSSSHTILGFQRGIETPDWTQNKTCNV